MRPPNTKVRFWHQVGLTFFIVSGGPYGLEGSVGSLGPGLAFFLVLLVPIIWVIPIGLMVAELSAMVPEQGGYYAWVRRALGRHWSFQEGWWTLCFSAVDLAIYPVLFVTYLSYFFPVLAGHESMFFWLRWLIGAIFVFLALALNLRGSRFVGLHSLIEMIIVFVPFVILVVAAGFLGDWSLLKEAFHNPTGGVAITPATAAAGLAIILWNYSGWDNVTTYADEVHEPHRTIPRALGFTIVLVIVSYTIPMLAGFKATILPKDWGETSGWPEIASRLVGPWLGIIVALFALISAWALFNSQLLYIARLPAAMAKDYLLPRAFGKVSEETGVPVISLVAAALVASVFCGLSLGKLMVVDILLYTLGLSLEFIALVVLRRKEPREPRPFRVPLPTWGLVLMSIIPLALAMTIAVFSAMGEDGCFLQVGIAVAVVIVGTAIYHWKYAKKRSENPI